jgi:hypothetical protein
MTYNLKIINQETKKETTYTIEDLKQIKIILENYKEELVDVELKKVKSKGE